MKPERNKTVNMGKVDSSCSCSMVLHQDMESQGMYLYGSFTAWLEGSANGVEVGWQVVVTHRLYHLTADHLVKTASL